VYEIDDELIVVNEEEITLIEANTPVFFDPIAHEIDNEVVQIPADMVIEQNSDGQNLPFDQYLDNNVDTELDVEAADRFESAQSEIGSNHDDISIEELSNDYINEIELNHSGETSNNILEVESNNNHIEESVNESLPSSIIESSRYNLRSNRAQPGRWKGAATSIRKSILDIGCRGKFNSDRRLFLKRQFGLNMTIKQGIKLLGYEAIKSVVKEMIQIVDRGTFNPINTDELSEDQLKMVITSKIFLKDKYTAQGVFDKIKARLVAGGHLQDRSIYDNGASPTVSTSSVFIVAGIAASEKRAVATVDFPGAFLYSEMPIDGPPIFMKLNKFETMVLCHIDPRYRKYVLNNGTCIVKLKRALYGCVKSARLWYELISKDLEELGFKKNVHDMCVFNRLEKDSNKQTTLVLHVDDMMITADKEETIDKFIVELQSSKRFTNLSIQRGKTLDYLGMTFDFSDDDKCKVTMNGYIKELLKEYCNIAGVVATPATNDLFNEKENSPQLDCSEKEFYHTLTAKLLYLGKRVRPDILTAVSYLVKKVQSPSEDDMKKLHRVVKYIRGTNEFGIAIEAKKALTVIAYVDASYAVHGDCKSHTGTVIGIGRGPIYCKSASQKLNTKSSTEAELVGLSDSTAQIIWTRNFLMEQGYEVDAATIYQDNMSTIAMVKNGKSNSDKTKHIAVRFYFVADRMKNGEIKVEYLRTGDMVADILTKPLQGAKFYELRQELLNWP
jgi:hypothetical protein